jgi:hypothetical protein
MIWKMDRPGGFPPGRCVFLSLAGQLDRVVVISRNQRETYNREPGNHEGND